jgi:hypothetical protein
MKTDKSNRKTPKKNAMMLYADHQLVNRARLDEIFAIELELETKKLSVTQAIKELRHADTKVT